MYTPEERGSNTFSPSASHCITQNKRFLWKAGPEVLIERDVLVSVPWIDAFISPPNI